MEELYLWPCHWASDCYVLPLGDLPDSQALEQTALECHCHWKLPNHLWRLWICQSDRSSFLSCSYAVPRFLPAVKASNLSNNNFGDDLQLTVIS